MLVPSLGDDIYNEGGRRPITIHLPDLDHVAITSFLTTLENNMPRYQIARNNCAHVVAKVLMEGSRRAPTFKPNAGQYSRLGKILGHGIWTPDQVLKYARELKAA